MNDDVERAEADLRRGLLLASLIALPCWATVVALWVVLL